MNCKQGDLAVIVRSYAGNEGKVVRCVSLCERPFWYTARWPGPTWHIDRELPGETFPVSVVADCQLRPLRDSDGEDEMLRLVGKPVFGSRSSVEHMQVAYCGLRPHGVQ